MRHYTTLFDKGYMPRGLAMHESLVKHSSSPFVLHVLAMDEETEDVLGALALPNVEVIPIGVFETMSADVNETVRRHRPLDQWEPRDHEYRTGLRPIRESRTWQEYCWTLASVFTNELMQFGITEVTYLDADLLFFSDPEVIHEEIKWRDIAVIPHRFVPWKRHLETNGRFNVSWVTFKGELGKACVSRWAEQCIKRCSATVGCGDQLYLDEWPERYGVNLCIVDNIGAGLAPWNVGNYAVTEGPAVNGRLVCFYHYHELRENEDGSFRLTNYELRPEDVKHLYEPYLEAYKRAKERIESVSILSR